MENIENIDLLTMLVFGLAEDSNAGAEFIERKAQTKSVSNMHLPVTSHNDEAWRKVGVVFGNPIEGDKLFREATLPAGWIKKATGHPMHTDILDGSGNRRGSYFYKGSPWDRDAILYSPSTRYAIESDYYANKRDEARGITSHTIQAVDRATGRVLFSATLNGPTGTYRDWSREQFTVNDQAEADCRAEVITWLESKYPFWNDPSKYWPDWNLGWCCVEKCGGAEDVVSGILNRENLSSAEEELLAIADAARLTGHFEEAFWILQKLRDRFPDSIEAREAAYDLALVERGRKNEEKELSWMEVYVTEHPFGSFAEKALNFLMSACVKSGNVINARAYAAQYLERFKVGDGTETANNILEPPKPRRSPDDFGEDSWVYSHGKWSSFRASKRR